MRTIDRNNILESLKETLVPSVNLIDGRTEVDHLSTLVELASLLNFYDRNNLINGNWQPFLLKDPVFLVASIAKTSFQKLYKLFINTGKQLHKAITIKANENFISNAFNQLFDQLATVFELIQQWTKFMINTSIGYTLKDYVLAEVKNTYSALLWAILELQKQLRLYNIVPKIQVVNSYLYDNYDQKTWKESKGKIPYWIVLGFVNPAKNEEEYTFDLTSISLHTIFSGLYTTGKKVFSFFNTCISYATVELEQIKNKKGSFPDTMLLRTFVDLLKVYKDKINTLSEKHLKFYYEDILKQQKQPVIADKTIICCDLAKPTTTYTLPKKTTFNAGQTEAKVPVLFETKRAVTLNPATLQSGFTLTKTKAGLNTANLYLNETLPLGKLTKNESGVIEKWKTFGSQLTPQGTAIKMGIAFASPMLYVNQATTRKIKIRITFSEQLTQVFQTILKNKTSYYLSTAKDWFLLQNKKNETPKIAISFPTKTKKVTTTTSTLKTPKVTEQKEVVFEITLLNTDPLINAFQKNPDGYSSDWPLFKMIFSEYEDLKNPPNIESIYIHNSVKELQDLKLYSDFGALNSKKPFQPLGPTPNAGQNFIVGSAEIFSKPIKDLDINLTWSGFTDGFDFSTYYKEYNDYLNYKYTGDEYVHDEKKLFSKILDLEKALFKKLLTSQRNFFKKIIALEKTVILKLIAKETNTLKKLVVAQHKELEKLINPENEVLQENTTAKQSLISQIEEEENKLVKNIKGTTVTEQDIHDLKATVLSKIKTVQQAIQSKILSEKTVLLSDFKGEEKSFFGRVISGIEHLFGGGNDTSQIEIPFQFTNDSFKVDFQWLENGLWNYFKTKENSDESVSSSDVTENLFATSTTTNTILSKRVFEFSAIKIALKNVNPSLQKKVLQFTDSSASGFIKMQLVAPSYGFGLDLYSKVVNAIALYNGRLIVAYKGKKALEAPANPPFTPVIQNITVNYEASHTYIIGEESSHSYPLECFYYSPFTTYKIYDTTVGINESNTVIGNVYTGKNKFPLFPVFSSEGQLFLTLENVIAASEIHFYFQLTRGFHQNTNIKKKIAYFYLSENGWKVLPIVKDGTHNFSCSGIITVKIPKDISSTHTTQSGNGYWISIATNTHVDDFSQTIFLKTNGIEVQRIVDKEEYSAVVPEIKANTITTPSIKIPQIIKTTQPFSSFGGKAAETITQMNERISIRLQTKDRLVTSLDYFNTIAVAFPEVYFSKSLFNKKDKKVITYVVKRVADITISDAFLPLISECKEFAIKNYVSNKTSVFIKNEVTNFTINYLKIKATIQVTEGYDPTQVSQEINMAINTFLAPWIVSEQQQITIDNGVNTAQLTTFIKTFDSVLAIDTIQLYVGEKNIADGGITYGDGKQEIIPKSSSVLLVPSLNNTTSKSEIEYYL